MINALLLWTALAAPPAHVAATADTWPSWRGDEGQTGRSPSALSDQLTTRWTWTGADAIVAGAVVDAARVYVGSKDGRMVALNRSTGALVWEVKAGGSIEAPGLLVGDVLVFGAKDRLVRAVDAATGALRWSADLGAEIIAAPSFVPAANGRAAGVVIGDYGGDVVLLDLATGAVRWTYPTGSYIYGSPAVLPEHAVIGGCDGYVHTLRLADGKPVAKVEVGAYVGASVATEGGSAWVGHFGNLVVGFDPLTGKVGWTHRDRSFPYLSSPAVGKEFIVLGGRDHMVRALEKGTGELWWIFAARERVESSPVIAGDLVIIGADDGRLYLLDAEDGHERKAFDLGAAVSATPAVAGGWVFVGTADGTLHALGPKVKK